jgi:hypothetical protein
LKATLVEKGESKRKKMKKKCTMQMLNWQKQWRVLPMTLRRTLYEQFRILPMILSNTRVLHNSTFKGNTFSKAFFRQLHTRLMNNKEKPMMSNVLMFRFLNSTNTIKKNSTMFFCRSNYLFLTTVSDMRKRNPSLAKELEYSFIIELILLFIKIKRSFLVFFPFLGRISPVMKLILKMIASLILNDSPQTA